jgi:hypothetical protein
MLRTITAKQFRELEVFEAMEPPESVRDDYRAASIATVIANVNRGKDHAAYQYDDFLVKWIDPEEEDQQQRFTQSREDKIATIRMIVAMNNMQPNLPEAA